MQRGARGAHAAARRRGPEGRLVRPLDAAPARRRHGGEPPAAASSRSTGPTSCRSCCRPRSASRRCWPGRATRPTRSSGGCGPTAYREFWEFTVEKVAVNAVMAGLRGRSICRSSSRWPRAASPRARARPRRSRPCALVNGPIRNEIGHELRDRRDGAVQPRQRDDRPRLRAALAEPPGRLGARRDLHGLAGQLRSATTPRSPRTRSAARGSRSTSEHGFDAGASTVSLFLGGWYTLFGNGPRDTWEEKLPALHARPCDPFIRPDRSAIDPDSVAARGFVERGLRREAEADRLAAPRTARVPARRVLGQPCGCRPSCARARCPASSRTRAT